MTSAASGPTPDARAKVHERARQHLELQLAVATASALPQRDPGPLRFPPFRTLLRR